MPSSANPSIAIAALSLLVTAHALAEPAPDVPPTAKQRLAVLLDAKDISGVDELVFRRTGEFDYLGVQAAFEVPWWWERTFLHGYVLRKKSLDPDWTQAELFDVRLPVVQVLSGDRRVLETELLPWKRPNQALQPTAPPGH
jgi:hypothetical protein